MKKIYLSLFASLFILASCDSSLDEMNQNPNKTEVAPPNMLATSVIKKMMPDIPTEKGKNFLKDQWTMKTLVNNEFAQPHMYNSIQSAEIDYRGLRDAKDMVREADRIYENNEGLRNSYNALNLFARGYTFFHTTMQLGDVPCTQNILAGLETGDFWPVYDPQETVFETIIKDLDEAATLFSKGSKLPAADFVYGGDVKKWEKASNSLLLNVLIQLSTKKATVGTINVKAKFEEVAKRPLFASYGEDFQVKYVNVKDQYYPFSKNQNNYANNTFLQVTLVDMLKKYKDNRLFYYAEPAKALKAKPADSFDAYMGIDGTAAFSDVVSEAKADRGSLINLRYSDEPTGEPVKRVSYAEINFILAEAALKGWATPKSAEEHYNLAVTAAMKFTTDFTPEKNRHGVTIDDAYITDYLKAGAPANYNDATNKLSLIMDQKYIAGFMQTQWGTYYDYRRTGLPAIPINPKTSTNEDATDKLPIRFTYSGKESGNNTKNMNDACIRQFGEAVNRPNDAMWILK